MIVSLQPFSISASSQNSYPHKVIMTESHICHVTTASCTYDCAKYHQILCAKMIKLQQQYSR